MLPGEIAQHGKTEHKEDKGFFMVVTRSWEQTTKREQSEVQVRGSD